MSYLRSLVSNLTTILLALVLAVIVWATAVRANDPVETRNLEIDVDIVGQPVDATLVSSPPESAIITLQGPASALDKITPFDYVGIIDLSNVPFGETEVSIEVQGEREQVNIESVFPETAQIQMEQIVTREIPVNLLLRGEVARGHRIGEARVEPEAVQVTGPAPRVSQLAESRLTVFVDNAREDITESRRLTFYDAGGNVESVIGMTVNPTEVEVFIPVIELAGFAEKPVTVDFVGEPAPGYRLLDVRVEPSSIQVTGSPALIDDLRVQTESVDISGLDESESRRVTLDLPDGVEMVEVQPVVVTVEIEPILSSDVVQRPVEVRALGEDLEAVIDPEEIRVFLFGPLPVLDSLAEEDVRVTVDLLNLVTGTHVLEPFVSVSAEEIEVRSTQPAQITAIITDSITNTDSLTATLPVTVSLSHSAVVSVLDGSSSYPPQLRTVPPSPVALQPRIHLVAQRDSDRR
jgi:YbbR domain-containing protein